MLNIYVLAAIALQVSVPDFILNLQLRTKQKLHVTGGLYSHYRKNVIVIRRSQ